MEPVAIARDAAAHPHSVQFYEDGPSLIEVVAEFVGAGLRGGAPAVVIATEAHRNTLTARLRADGIDVTRATALGDLVLLDAERTLSRFMVGSLPDRGRFLALAESLLMRCARQSKRTRCYGEMVNVLCAAGNPAGAHALEELWNELSGLHAFNLLCGYAMAHFQSSGDAAAFERVCGAHGHVVPTERWTRLPSADARQREVSALQQRAQALLSETAERERLERELLGAGEVRDTFMCLAGHELKTPLTALALQMRELLMRASDPSLRQRLERAQRQTSRLLRLADELLDVSRLHAGRLKLEPQPCDLAALTLAVVDRTAEAAGRAGCPLRVDAPTPVPGHWDPWRLEQVVSNLLANALKYGAGKPVELRVTVVEQRARLTVTDEGVGIPLEDQARIFERFERSGGARHFGGLGLGLWVARQVVDAHQGTLSVRSAPGAGATFTLELPFA